MTYDEFVTAPLRLSRRISHKEDEVIIKANIATKMTSTIGGEITSGSKENKNEQNMVRYLDAKNELEKLYEELEREKSLVRSFFYEALDIDMADVMEWKYIDGKSLQDIAVMKGVEYQTIKNKASKADREARKKYQKVLKSTKKYQIVPKSTE